MRKDKVVYISNELEKKLDITPPESIIFEVNEYNEVVVRNNKPEE